MVDWSSFWPGLLATTTGVGLALLGQAVVKRSTDHKRRSNLRQLLLSNIREQRRVAEDLQGKAPWPGNLLETFDTTTLAVGARDHYYVADDIDLLEKIDEFRIHLESVDRYYLKRLEEDVGFISRRKHQLPAELEKAINLADEIIHLLENKS